METHTVREHERKLKSGIVLTIRQHDRRNKGKQEAKPERQNRLSAIDREVQAILAERKARKELEDAIQKKFERYK